MGFLVTPQKNPKRRDLSVMSEINVTPMVDVMLVLLVIFMVAAPLMTTGVPVDLPRTQAPALQEKTKPLIVSLNQEGKIFLQETAVDLEGLGPRLLAMTGGRQDACIYIRADRSLSYGRVMEIIGWISQAGFPKVALISEANSQKPGRRTPKNPSSPTPAKTARKRSSRL